MLKYILLVLMMVALAGAAMVRVRPVDAAKYHVQDLRPELVSGRDGQFSVGQGGDIPAVKSDMELTQLGAALAERIESTPRTQLLAGSLSEGPDDTRRIATFVTRSQVFGFPDVTVVQLDRGEGGGTEISMKGRQVYGVKDFGVNEARLREWLSPFGN
ncbi:uncharacterized protein DUF1499 [Litoreibacter ponti]|uniref:Uncharacterized protein DUF1499 n=1 Tax=Litoreibacter ponti TaxID=1510457 RepID=A0A2T6BHY7_9RHOB|nr:DUF1499 domain-containing protein [Litoreibacter ponti]PTX55683.1 uncharacterized protein DUF1499 [Litoreibacter ponti]